MKRVNTEQSCYFTGWQPHIVGSVSFLKYRGWLYERVHILNFQTVPVLRHVESLFNTDRIHFFQIFTSLFEISSTYFRKSLRYNYIILITTFTNTILAYFLSFRCVLLYFNVQHHYILGSFCTFIVIIKKLCSFMNLN